jgi:hypothetical protein
MWQTQALNMVRGMPIFFLVCFLHRKILCICKNIQVLARTHVKFFWPAIELELYTPALDHSAMY